MANFLQDILKETNGEEILAITLGGTSDYYYADKLKIPEHLEGKTLQFTPEIQALLNYEYDTGYGAVDCHDVVIWTAENVYYIHEYDGSTRFHSKPRNFTLSPS